MVAGNTRGEIVYVGAAAGAEEVVVAVGGHATQPAFAVHGGDEDVGVRVVHAPRVAEHEEIDLLRVGESEVDAMAVALGGVERASE